MNAMRKAALKAALGPARRDPETGDAIMEFMFSVDFLGFQGHFPDYPILPAVAQILLASVTVSAVEGGEVEPARVDRAKFFRPIGPGERVTARVSRVERAGMIKHEASIAANDELAASFLILMRSGGADA